MGELYAKTILGKFACLADFEVYRKQPAEPSYSDPLKSSPESHCQAVSNSVGITNSCSLLAFLFSCLDCTATAGALKSGES